MTTCYCYYACGYALIRMTTHDYLYVWLSVTIVDPLIHSPGGTGSLDAIAPIRPREHRHPATRSFRRVFVAR